jgi:hypothetical protein
VIAEGGLEVLLEREKLALNAVRRDSEPGGAAEALRFLARKAVRRKMQSYGGAEAVKKALGTAIPFRTWCAQWQSAFETEVVRLVQQAAWAPRSLEDIKRFPGVSRLRIEPVRALQMTATLKKAVALIRDLDRDEYWGEVAQPGLQEALDLYADNLSTVAQRLLRLDRSPTFRNAGHSNDEWVLENIRRLTGRFYREKTTVIMRAVCPLAGHHPVEAESLRRWQRRRRPR